MQATSSVIYGTQVIQVSVQENSHRKTPRLSIVILPHLAFSQYLQPARYLRPACERCSGSRCHSYSKRDRETRERETPSRLTCFTQIGQRPTRRIHIYCHIITYVCFSIIRIIYYVSIGIIMYCKVIMFQKEYLAIVIKFYQTLSLNSLSTLKT